MQIVSLLSNKAIMASNKPTTAIILDTRRCKTDGTYPVKLRVTHKRQSKLFGTVFSLSQEEFGKVMGEKPRNPYKEIRVNLNAVENRANDIIMDMAVFSFDDFAARLTGKVGEPSNVFSAFEQYINEMNEAERVGNAYAYKCAMNSLKDFYPKPKLVFDEIDKKFLNKYEAWALRKGNNKTTVGIYLRCLRALYNIAISRRGAKADSYPFGRGGYQIPAPRNIKKALHLQDIKGIFTYEPTSQPESLYRDLWIFSYLCNGANMKDICLLRYGDISGSTVQFRRAKTTNSSRNAKPIVAGYSDHLRTIIERWGNKPVEPDEFIFPFLQPGLSEKQIKDRVAGIVKQTNKHIDRISKAAGIEMKVTTYTARHSFATTLKRSGVNVSFISEAMGHSDIKTTENYLGSIEDTDRNRIAEILTSF